MTLRHDPRPWLAIAGLITYGAVLFSNVSYAVGGSDSSGYANTARLLTRGRIVERIEPLDRFSLPDRFAKAFIPLAFVPAPQPRAMAPFYPVGTSLHMALVASLIGWSSGPYFVSPLAALGSLVVLYFLGRELRLPRGLAIAAAAILASCAVFVSQALQSMSDVLATFWCAAAVLAALRARRRAWWAILAGAAFGMAILVRPTNLLVLPAVLLALPLRPAVLALFGAGGIPAAAAFFGYNAAAYGSPFQTGYVMTGLLDGFSWSYFPVRFRHYGYWTAAQLSPLVLLGWLALPADRRPPLRDRALLSLWFAGFFLFYCFYAPYETWEGTRFLLPGMPGLILGALVSVRDFFRLESKSSVGRILAVSFVALALAFGVHWCDKLRVRHTAREQAILPEVCHRAAALFPAGSLVVSSEMSGALKFYTSLIPVRWDRLDPASFAELRSRTEEAGARWFALMIDFEVPQAAPMLLGDWRFLEQQGSVSFWALPPLVSR